MQVSETRPGGMLWIAFAIAATLALAACGSGGETEPAADELTSTSEAVSTTSAPLDDSEDDEMLADEAVDEGAENDSEPEEGSEGDSAAIRRDGVENLALPAGATSLPILGGIEFVLPSNSSAILSNSCVLILVPDYDGASPFPPNVSIAEVRYSGMTAQSPVDDVAGWLALYGDEPAPVPTGETTEVLGNDFELYRVENAFPGGPPPGTSFLNCSVEEGVLSEFGFVPSVYSDSLVAEVDGSLYLISASGFSPEDQLDAQALLDQILPTLTRADS